MQRVAQAWRRVWLVLLLCLPSVPGLAAQDALPGIAIADLPKEARATLHLILHDGPFPYARDGAVFGNYEHRLPEQPHGYYHEYTVKTPGAHNRGPRRIVCGIVPECYYTGDHYRSFKRIVEQQ